MNHKHIIFEFPKNLISIGNNAFYDGTSLFADFDLPDLEYIGEHAFENTNINNIVFHNKLVSVGFNSFYYYTYIASHPGKNQTIREGKRNVVFDSQLALYYAGIDMYYSPVRQAFGKIVFTENITNLWMQNQSDRQVFIYGATFDEIDMSQSGIKNLPAKAFSHCSIGKMTLPENLETIGDEAFYGVQIDEEVVLPETLASIGRNAFNAAFNSSHSAAASPFSDGRGIQYENKLGVIITKLPKSLQTIDVGAFYGDVALIAEVDLPNLTKFEVGSFVGTNITGLHWYKNTRYNGPAFGANYSLKNVILETVVEGVRDIRFMIGGATGFNYQNKWVESNKTIDDLQYETIKLTSDVSKLPTSSSFFYGVTADVIDLSETTITTINASC